jgi:hypothetical protein
MFPLSSGRGGKKKTNFFKGTNTPNFFKGRAWCGHARLYMYQLKEHINFAFGKIISVV